MLQTCTTLPDYEQKSPDPDLPYALLCNNKLNAHQMNRLDHIITQLSTLLNKSTDCNLLRDELIQFIDHYFDENSLTDDHDTRKQQINIQSPVRISATKNVTKHKQNTSSTLKSISSPKSPRNISSHDDSIEIDMLVRKAARKATRSSNPSYTFCNELRRRSDHAKELIQRYQDEPARAAHIKQQIEALRDSLLMARDQILFNLAVQTHMNQNVNNTTGLTESNDIDRVIQDIESFLKTLS
jgi:DNA-binding FrmR family transcriptional regulator